MSEFNLIIQKTVFCVDKHENGDVKAMSHLAAGWLGFSDNSLKCMSSKIFNLRNIILGFSLNFTGGSKKWYLVCKWSCIYHPVSCNWLLGFYRYQTQISFEVSEEQILQKRNTILGFVNKFWGFTSNLILGSKKWYGR